MNDRLTHVAFHVRMLEAQYLDAVEARNTSKPGSKREDEANATIEEIERHVSSLVFGDSSHTFSQCDTMVTMWSEPDAWMLGRHVRLARSKGYPILLLEETPLTLDEHGRFCVTWKGNSYPIHLDDIVRKK